MTPLTNSIEETIRQIIIPNAGIAMKWDEMGLSSKVAAQSIITKIKESLPEKKDGEFESKLKVIGYHEQYVKGWNQAVKKMEDKLG